MPADQQSAPGNRLGAETSPYLRQHQDNPVHWRPWGPEAFAEATARDVPVLLSVGYSACHWCHVMAHESFEDDEVAELMNRLFVNVKVDREERPDVDAIYMDAVQAMTGRGGWPMTVFLSPDGHPFYGGTYFPKAQFVQLLQAIDDAWRNKREQLEGNVNALRQALARSAHVQPASSLPPPALIGAAVEQLVEHFDTEWGGFGSAPKFPSTMNLDVVMRAHRRRPSQRTADVIETTLDAMASGGMYDHIGGGFARYSVDERWLVPHFEKMLYDQALLARCYLHGWQLLGHERWRQVVEETISYVLTVLRHPGGGLFSAEDADSLDASGHSHEGAFYTWTTEEVRALLGADSAVAEAWYELTPEGNFEGRCIPARLHHRGDLLRPDDVERCRQAMFAARATRPRPLLDDKVLTEWNGLMLATLAEAAAALQRSDWLDAALATGTCLLDNLRTSAGRWHRSWQADGHPPARHAAVAADHAALVDAFTRLGEASGQRRWIDAAREVADVVLDHFWDVDHGGVFTTADDAEQLVARQKDLLDNATPSANSMAAVALYRLAALTGERRYANHADQILRLLGAVLPSALSAFGLALAALELATEGVTEVAVVGDRPDLLATVQARWLPTAVVAWGEPYGGPLWEHRTPGFAYVCRDYACQAPAATVEELAAELG